MNFGQALEALKDKRRIARRGWNGKDMYIFYTPLKTVANKYRENGDVHEAHIDMFTARETVQPGWLASQSDMLADDWYIV